MIVAQGACLPREHLRIRVAGLPASPGGPDEANLLQTSAGQGTVDTSGENLRIFSVGSAVVHDEITVDQLPGDTKLGIASIETEGGSGQGTVGDADLILTDAVVDYFVPDQNLLRIGTRLPVTVQADDPILIHEKALGCRSGTETGTINRRNAILAWPGVQTRSPVGGRLLRQHRRLCSRWCRDCEAAEHGEKG